MASLGTASVRRLFSLLIAGSVLLCGPALALNGRVYQSSPNGGQYTPVASIGGFTASGPSVSITQPSTLHPVAFGGADLYIRTQTMLNEAVAASAQQSVGNVPVGSASLSVAPSGILSGTMQVTVTGTVTGELAVIITVPRFVHWLTLNHRIGALASSTCGITATLDNIQIRSTVFAGSFLPSGPTTVTYSPSYTHDCDNNLWWLPGVTNLLDYVVRTSISSQLYDISGIQTRVISLDTQKLLFGLISAMADNTYIVNGTDVGKQIRLWLLTTPALFQQKWVQVSISQPASFYVPTLWNNNPGPTQKSGMAISFDFADYGQSIPPTSIASFGIRLTRNFSWTLIEGEE